MREEPIVILLVEDDDGHAQLIMRNLKRAGVANEMIRARDGRDALDFIGCTGSYANRTPKAPLLIVLDINMPRVDGVEVLRILKADAETAKIPVIMLTTTDDPREIDRCYALGCSVYISKPIKYENFVDALNGLGMFLEIIKVPTAREKQEPPEAGRAPA